MEKFQVGVTYFARSIGDHNCIWTVKVVARTAKTIRAKVDGGPVKSFRVKPGWTGNEEICSPLGRYSMAPICGAFSILPVGGVESLQDYRQVMRGQ